MTIQETTHDPAAVEETPLFEAAPLPLIFEEAPPPALPEDTPIVLEVEPLPTLESAPPLLLESVPTPFPEGEPTPSLDDAPPPSPPKPAAKPEPEHRVNNSAPDPFAVGVRLLRMAPVWLLLTTFGCAAVVLLLGWMKAGGGVSAVTLSRKQNDARAVKTTPKANAEGAKTAADNSPDVSTPPAEAPRVADANPSAAPAPQAAQAQSQLQPPAIVEQPAPAAAPQAAEKPQVEQPAPVGDANAKFTVQVGSYNNQSEANAHISRLRAAGFESRSASVELPGRGTWYRVQVGRFAERAEASKAVTQLRAKGAASGAIVAPLQN
jgi:cell division septation protein DedD